MPDFTTCLPGILMNVQRKLFYWLTGVVISTIAVIAVCMLVQKQPEQTASTTNTPATTTPDPAFDKKRQSTTDPSSVWVIVNKQHPITPQTYAPPDLTSVGNGQRMRAEAATALLHMFSDAKAAGFTLVADSGYRSYSDQVAAYGSIAKAYGQTYADTVSARPGYSEHQTGWAVDIGSGNCNVADCFGDLPAGKWSQANAYKYGFILRYTQADSSVTGYSAEAWHFRYVGTALSNKLHQQHIATLEQFFDVSGGTTYKPAP